MDTEKPFNEKEIALILTRAAELSRSIAEEGAVERKGITLDELERIAGEAGIAPELVRQAAAEFATPAGKRSAAHFFLGGATKRTLALEVPVPVGRETLERALLELPRIAGGPGSGFVSPDGLTWSFGSDTRQSAGYMVSVEIRVEGERTKVEIAENRGGIAGGLFGGIVGGIGCGMGVPFAFALGPEALGWGPWASLLLGLAPAALAWFACRFGFVAFAKKRDAKLEKLRDELKRILENR